MVHYQLIDIDEEGYFIYEYWNENRTGEKGLASLDAESCHARIVKEALGGFGWHERHLLNGLERKLREGKKIPEKGYFAWY